MAAPRKVKTIPDLEKELIEMDEQIHAMREGLLRPTEPNLMTHELLERRLSELQSAHSRVETELNKLKLSLDPVYLFQYRKQILSEIEQLNMELVRLSDEDQNSNTERKKLELQTQKRELAAKLDVTKSYDLNRIRTVHADQKARTTIAMEQDDLQRLVEEYVTRLKTDIVKFFQSLTNDELKLLQKTAESFNHEDGILIKKYDLEFLIDLRKVCDYNGNWVLKKLASQKILINKLLHLLEILSHLNNPYLTSKDMVVAIQRELNQSTRAEIKKNHAFAASGGSTFLTKIDSILLALREKLVPEDQKELNHNVTTMIEEACKDYIAHISHKIPDAFRFVSDDDLIDFADFSLDTNGVNFTVHANNSAALRPVDLGVVLKAKDKIPEEYHYLLEKGAALSELKRDINSNNVVGMMERINNKTFRDTIKSHKKAVTNLFASSNTESAKFLAALDHITAYYNSMSNKLAPQQKDHSAAAAGTRNTSSL
jgi:hypothetical protein